MGLEFDHWGDGPGGLELGADRSKPSRINGERLGHQRLLVGYRDDDPRRFTLGGDIGGGVPAGKCIDCHHDVFLDPSGLDCLRTRDPALACMFCQDHFRYVERAHQSGMVVQV